MIESFADRRAAAISRVRKFEACRGKFRILLQDFIEPLGITRYRLAKAIGVQQRRIDEICAGKRSITAQTAVRLGLAFSVDPQFRLNLQTQYDIEVIQREQGTRLSEEVHELAA